jgi:hypothetical protein
MRPQVRNFCSGKVKREISREPIAVPPDLLVEPFCCDAVESCEVNIEKHLLASNNQNPLLDSLSPDNQ